MDLGDFDLLRLFGERDVCVLGDFDLGRFGDRDLDLVCLLSNLGDLDLDLLQVLFTLDFSLSLGGVLLRFLTSRTFVKS